MTNSIEIPDCFYPKEPALVRPSSSTPRHTLYLSNLDDQKFLRFSIKYLYLYKKPVAVEALKASLSKVLVDYYPLAGRLRTSADDCEKLEVDCNGEGALLAEGFVDLTGEEFMESVRSPNKSWRKLLYRVEAQSFIQIPPLVVQVTRLRCGGMILCTSISHSLCDGIGTSQFLHAWAQATAKPGVDPPMAPFHGRYLLKPRNPPQVVLPHPEFSVPSTAAGLEPHVHLLSQFLSSQPLVPVCITFTASQILHLKKRCVPSLKCTSFEALASHVWRAWVKALNTPSSLSVKLLFSVSVRGRLKPELPRGYYGNGFVLACAEATADRLVTSNVRYGVTLVQGAKERLTNEFLRSTVDLLEERRGIKPDLSSSLVISQWSKLGLEDLDFGAGRPLHMGPLASEIYCLFLPVVGDLHAFTMLVSVPQSAAHAFEHYCLKGLECDRVHDQEDEKINDGGIRGYY